MTRIVITDDHPIILQALVAVFSQHRDLEVVALCRSGDACLDAIRDHHPDLVILDLSMPGRDGLAVLREMNASAVSARVVLWTAAYEEDELLEAIRLGAAGVVLKEMDTGALIDCVRRVASGQMWIDRRSIAAALRVVNAAARSAQESSATLLSPREMDVVRLLSRGRSNKEIANLLAISAETVKKHIQHVYEKLRLTSRAELAIYAKEKGFL